MVILAGFIVSIVVVMIGVTCTLIEAKASSKKLKEMIDNEEIVNELKKYV